MGEQESQPETLQADGDKVGPSTPQGNVSILSGLRRGCPTISTVTLTVRDTHNPTRILLDIPTLQKAPLQHLPKEQLPGWWYLIHVAFLPL